MDNQVNPGTGSISVRGIVANPRPVGGTHLLVPGMFVRVRLPIGQPKDELLVIDRAITSDQGLKYVYVMDASKKVDAKRVTIGSLQDNGLRVITQGLKRDDWVLVGGLQQVRPRMAVVPEYLDAMPTLGNPVLPKEKAKTKKTSK
jgi:membrane fusion protein, multidrug efflux system